MALEPEGDMAGRRASQLSWCPPAHLSPACLPLPGRLTLGGYIMTGPTLLALGGSFNLLRRGPCKVGVRDPLGRLSWPQGGVKLAGLGRAWHLGLSLAWSLEEMRAPSPGPLLP